MEGSDEQIRSALCKDLGIPVSRLIGVDTELSNIILKKLCGLNDLKATNDQLNQTIKEMEEAQGSEVNNLKEALAKSDETNVTLTENIKTQHGMLENVNQQYQDNKELIEKYQSEINTLRTKNVDSQQHALSLQKIVDEAAALNGKLNTDDSTNLQTITELRSEIIALGGAVEKMREEQGYQMIELRRKDEEIGLLTTHRTWLEKEIKRQADSTSPPQDTIDSAEDIIQELDQVKGDNKLLKNTQQLLQEKNRALSLEIEGLSRELKGEKDNTSIVKANLERELHSREQLCETFSGQVKDLHEQCHTQTNMSIDVQERERLLSELSLAKSDTQEYKDKFEKMENIVIELTGNNSTELNMASPDFILSSLRISNEVEVESLKRKLLQEKQQKEDIQREMQIFINEMESRVPFIEGFQKRAAELETQLLKTTEVLKVTSANNEDLTLQFENLQRKHENEDETLKALRLQRSDLARQVQLLLLALPESDQRSGALSLDEIHFVKKVLQNENINEYDDSQRVITENFLDIRNVKDLQSRNIDLIATVRNLAAQLEQLEKDKTTESSYHTTRESNTLIQDLKRRLSNSDSKIKALTVELDSLKMLSHTPSQDNDDISNQVSTTTTSQSLKDMQDTLSMQQRDHIQEVSELKSSIAEYIAEIGATRTSLEESELKSQALEKRITHLTTELGELGESRRAVIKQLENAQGSIEFLTNSKSSVLDELSSIQQEASLLRSSVQKGAADHKTLSTNNELLQRELIDMHEDRNNLKIKMGELENIRFRLESNNITFLEKETHLKTELETLKKQYHSQGDAIEAIENARSTEITWFKTELAKTEKVIEERRADIDSLRNQITKLVMEQDDLKDGIIYFGSSSSDDATKNKSTNLTSNTFNVIKNDSELSREQKFKGLLTAAKSDSDAMRSTLKANSVVLENKLTDLEKEKEELLHSLSSTNNESHSLREQLNELHHVIEHEQNRNISESIEIKELSQNALQVSNNYTSVNVNGLQKDNEIKHSMADNLNTLLHSLENTISSLQGTLTSKENEVTQLRKENYELKTNNENDANARNADLDKQSSLEQAIIKLQSAIEVKEEENRDMNDKFNRLKKQAHERLDSTKTITAQLNEEINSLRKSNEELQERLKDNVSDNLGVRLEDDGPDGIPSLPLSELPAATDNTDIQQLMDEVTYLKAKLSLLEDTEKNSDVNQNLKSTDLSPQSSADVKPTPLEVHEGSPVDDTITTPGFSKTEMDNMKQKWQAEWEIETNQRIENAKEDLKKHLRQPAEAKINHIVEKRKQELEEEFENKVKEKAESIVLSNSFNLTANQIKEKLSEEMKSETKKEMEELRKKSFEEGRQQESMKTMILQRKLSKLDGSQNTSSNTDDNKPSSTRKIDQLGPLEDNSNDKKVSTAPENKPTLFVPISSSSSQLSSPPSNPFTFGSKPSVSTFGTSIGTKLPFQGASFGSIGTKSPVGTQWIPFSNDSAKRTFGQTNFDIGTTSPTVKTNHVGNTTTDDDNESQSPKRSKNDS